MLAVTAGAYLSYHRTEEVAASDRSSFVNAVYNGMLNQDESIIIRYTGRDYREIHDEFLNTILKEEIFQIDDPKTSDDCDYMNYNLDEVQINTRSQLLTGVSISIFPKWKETKEETRLVNQRIEEILEELGTEGKSDYTKIKLIHDYVVENVEYDQELLRCTVYEALYEGLATCQGYMLLTYKLLSEAGVPVRCVDGTATNSMGTESHGWNIVKLGDYWYNLDTTWDDPVLLGNGATQEDKEAMKYVYFLKGNISFSKDHARSEAYDTAEFNQNYPVASEDYEPAEDIFE